MQVVCEGACAAVAAGFLALFGGAAVAGGMPERPNVVLIVADDLGAGDVRYLRRGDFLTPNIDRLAAQSTSFTQAYITAAVCSPSRAGLHTGRYQARFGHDFNPGSARDMQEMSLPQGEVTIAERLHAAGYYTGLVGKWHLEGRRPGSDPQSRGFDEYFGFASGGTYILNVKDGDLVVPVEGENENRTRNQGYSRDRKPVTRDAYLTDVVTDESLAFLDKAVQRKQPFLLVAAHHAPHVPLEATKTYVDRVAHIRDPRRRVYAAMITALDESVGRIVDALDQRGLSDNTLVVFLSDNGCPPYIAEVCQNAPFSGHKRDLGEGGIRTPLLIRWPGVTSAGKKIAAPVISLDVGATILAAAGLADQIPQIDGRDLRRNLAGSTAPPHPALYWRAGPDRAIRYGDWKAIQVTGTDGAAQTFLFNLKNDPAEKRNLAKSQPDRVRAMFDAWSEWDRANTPSRMTGRVTTTRIGGVEVQAHY